MRGITVWARLLGLQRAVLEDVMAGSEGAVIVSVPSVAGAGSVWCLPAPVQGDPPESALQSSGNPHNACSGGQSSGPDHRGRSCLMNDPG